MTEVKMADMLYRDYTCEEFEGNVLFSENLKYRYYLGRDWPPYGGDRVIVFILLNPSTGDEKKLETTTAGCAKRALAWKYNSMIVLNLFAYIATNPNELVAVTDPVGKYGNKVLMQVNEEIPEHALFVAAWGNHGKLHNRDKEVIQLLSNRDLYCLGQNKDGSPRHPLHMSHSITPTLWRAAKQ